MQFTKASYFDGVSSTPYSKELFLDEKNEVIYFSLNNGEQVNWSISDLNISSQNGIINIQFEDDNLQIVKIENRDFIDYFNSYLKSIDKSNWYQNLLNLGLTIHVFIAIGIIGIIILSYVYILPNIAEKAVIIVPETYDKSLGEDFYNQFISYNEVDSARTESLQKFANQLQLENKKPLYFTVVKSDVVNAFALPDGHIVVFTGLLDLMENYDELVGLLGHEVTHVNERHTLKMLSRNIAGYLLVSAILSDVNGIMATIADNLNGIYSLTFSRSYEKEADMKGFEIMKINKTNPNGICNLFLRLKKGNKTNIEVPEFLSSHPITDSRIEYIKEVIKSNPFKYQTNNKLEELFKEIKKIGSK
jgi:predicted Zn-dependent protease